MPPKMVPPHYECLGVDPTISDADLSRHYKKLSLQLHPDRAAYRNDAANEVHVQARYQSITEAYAILSDPEKRNAYDTKYSVNFRSRLVRLQAAIGQHNTASLQRFTAPTSTAEAIMNANAEKGRPVTHTVSSPSSATAVKDEEDDDDDDDYVPEALPSSSFEGGAARRFTTGSKQAHSAEVGCSGFVEVCEDDDDEDGIYSRRVRQLFFVQPCPMCASSSLTGTVSEDGQLMTQYRGVTLTRTRATASSNSSDEAVPSDPLWGLLFEGSAVTGVRPTGDGVRAGQDGAVKGLAAMVFPALVQQLNDAAVRPTTEIARLLERDACKTSGSTTSAQKPETEEQLHLVLAFCVVKYSLIGDLHLLRDEALLTEMVPTWCAAAEIPALLPGVRVLAVNGTVVHSAEELRRALHSVDATSLEEGSAAGEGTKAAKRPRVGASIVLDCCQFPFD